MRTTSVTLFELGSILDRSTVSTSTYAGVFHIISGRHPDLGRITVVQGISEILRMTEEPVLARWTCGSEAELWETGEAPAMLQAA